MFAKLRPGHRRSGSTPTSPSPNQIPSGFLPIPPSSSHGPTSPSSIDDFLHGFKSPASQASGGSGGDRLQRPMSNNAPVESPISPLPPALPPIPRVASVYQRPEEEGRAQHLGGSGGMQVQHPELHRAKTTESFESASSGSPILGDQMFSPARHEQWSAHSQSQSQDSRLRDSRSPNTYNEGHYRSPSSQLTSPPVRREAGVSESEFRSILQGKHLPPLPPGPGNSHANAPQRRVPDIVSPPPISAEDSAHQAYSRHGVMSLGNQSRQSLASTSTARTSDRAGKTKTRLLNPMSLLLKRRNGQMLDHLAEESLVSHRNPNMISPGLPDDYDPSIRGKVVHDFSAPRPRRNFSNQNMTELAERERQESYSREAHAKSRALSEDLRHERQHTPVFKEHFEDDDTQSGAADSALRAETLANKDFVTRNSLLPSTSTHDELAVLPPFARVGQKTVYKPPQEQPSIPSPPPPPVPAKDQNSEETLLPPRQQAVPLSPLLEDPISPNPDLDTDATPKRASDISTIRQSTITSRRSPASARSSRISRMNSAASANGLPAHMFSRASRFSFQYANTDSAAQERMLEEKHREKAAKAKAERGSVGYDDEDDFDYDDLDMDAMDDDVPMNGEDWYGGAGAGVGGGLGIGNMTLEDMSGHGGGLGGMSLDDFGGGGGLGGTSMHDFEGNGLEDDDEFGGGGLGGMTLDDMPGSTSGGLGHMTLETMASKTAAPAVEEAPTYNPLQDNSATTQDASSGAIAPAPQGLGIDTSGPPQSTPTTQPLTSSAAPSNRSSTGLRRKPVGSQPPTEQDDFYFDNGDFADEDFLREINGPDGGNEAFDESVFDDPNHPLYERKQVLPTHAQAPPIPRMSSKRTHNTMRGRKPRSRPPSDPLPEHPDPGAPSHQVEAYQSALALFATKAAAAGRFERANSVDSTASSSPLAYHGGPVLQTDKPPSIPNEPELTPDVARLSQESSTLSPPTARASGGNDLDSLSKSVGFMLPGSSAGSGGMGMGIYDDSYASDFDYSDYDSTFEDDPMIAAANAEALENDDEGLYGSEFGFYARPGATETDTAGGDASMYGGYFGPKNWGEIKRQRSTREPNLTPITERSEYSTRNSFIGLGFAEGQGQGMSSPALAQLARMSPGWEGDMNMETLLKLRRGAWGGSQGDKSSPRASSSSPMNTSPILPKGESVGLRGQQWSSPMSRSMFGVEDGIPEADAEGEGGAEEEFDEAMLAEANYVEEGEELYDEDEEDGPWQDDLDAEDGADEQGISPLDDSPLSESPTIRAHAPPQHAHSPSVSPMKLGPPFTFPTTVTTTDTQPQISPITTSSPSTTALTNTATSLATHSARSSAVLVSPISPSIGSAGGHFKPAHSRSGSDSVSYSRERDEVGGEFRWVLERRRTAEDGGEVVERTAVEGGRI